MSNNKKQLHAYEGNAPYIFVSYAHLDYERVEPYIRRLMERGFNVWFDEGITPGSEWSEFIFDRIKNCSVFIYFITAKSIESENCKDEISAAKDLKKLFINILLDELDLKKNYENFLFRYGRFQMISYKNSNDMEDIVAKIENRIKSELTSKSATVNSGNNGYQTASQSINQNQSVTESQNEALEQADSPSSADEITESNSSYDGEADDSKSFSDEETPFPKNAPSSDLGKSGKLKANTDSLNSSVISSQYVRQGNKIFFGSYPQALVIDTRITKELEKGIGALPTIDDAADWDTYGFYINGSNKKHFMWYLDAVFEGKKYRGVYFTSFRPYSTEIESTPSLTYQNDNGFELETVYWFSFEPISWSILKETDDEALVLSDFALDSEEFFVTSNGSARMKIGSNVYENNYKFSSIRKWLNETFYDCAFTDSQKKIILNTEVDNTPSSTGYRKNKYALDCTSDKVFLLSYKELDYLNNSIFSGKKLRKHSSDYAKILGLWSANPEAYCYWWLRSPNNVHSNFVRHVSPDGSKRDVYNTSYAFIGIVAALTIKLK